MLTQAEADSIAEGSGSEPPLTLWAWAQCYVGGPEHAHESSTRAAARVLEKFDATSLANVVWKLDGWPGFRPRLLAYELAAVRDGDVELASELRARRLAETARVASRAVSAAIANPK